MRFLFPVAMAAAITLYVAVMPVAAESRHSRTVYSGEATSEDKASRKQVSTRKAIKAKRYASGKKRKARYAKHYDRRSTRRTYAKRKHTRSVAHHAAGGGHVGVASYYWQPQRVASGGWFNPNAMTAAHKTLPFGTRVRVTHLGNGRSVTVTINDRGPYIAGRIIDLSKAAASAISMTGQGVARIQMVVLGR